MTRKTFQAGMTILAIALVALVLSAVHIGRQAERIVYDTNLQYLSNSALPPEIILVAIDDNTLDLVSEEMGGLHWPYPRSFHAQVLDHLAQAGARAVFVDVLFDLPSGYGQDDDQALAASLRKLPVILAGEFTPAKIIPPLALFTDHGGMTGNVAIPIDIDHCIRNMRQAAPLPPTFGRTLGWFAFGLFPASDSSLSSFNEVVPNAEQALFSLTRPEQTPPRPGFIHYFGPAGSTPTVSWYQVFQPDLFALVKDRFKNKVVFVGKTISASLTPDQQSDVFPTPVDHDLMAGVEIRANSYASLITGKTRYLISPLLFAALFVVWVVLFSLVMFRVQSPLKGFLVMIVGLSLLLAGNAVFFRFQWVAPVVPFLFFSVTCYVFILGRRYLEARDRFLLTRAQLFHYLPERVARHVMKHPVQLAMAGDRTVITLLFADIAGFTTLSETTPPEDIIPLLQNHLGDMTRAIFDHQGTLDKYLGDGIMAFWGAPEHQADHADLALRAAREMLCKLDEANEKRRRRGVAELHMRIGLHTGDAVVGNIGSELFIDYTAIGDNVNTASRIEGVSKYFGVRLSISGECIAALKDGRPEMVFPMGAVAVKGKKEPISLYTIAPPALSEAFRDLDEYLNLLNRQAFDQAQQQLDTILTRNPDFGPAIFHNGKFETTGQPLVTASGLAYWPLESK